MPFIPHTPEDVRTMLETIGADTVDDLFDEIPSSLRVGTGEGAAPGLDEMQVMRLMRERAAHDGGLLAFLGGGAYEHHIPAAVWQIATRGEFYSSYTPYQAEASQGTLQLLYEYQTMMTSMTGLDVTNASLYDGASALAEAVLMAVRVHRGARRVVIPRTVSPAWRRVVRAIVHQQDIELDEAAIDMATGRVAGSVTEQLAGAAALVIPQPNYFGVLEEVDALTDAAHAHGALAIGVVNPTALALLKPPGEWGAAGADIAVGDGQPLGVPLSGGGPYFGFMATRSAHMRQMPGRIVGRTVDANGAPGYTLTLQAREQHIRRSKATSNICTNQGLMVTAATIYMALLGPAGLTSVAQTCRRQTERLTGALAGIAGCQRKWNTPGFHESVIALDRTPRIVLQALRVAGILGGIDLTDDYPELGNALLVCATETKSDADLERYAAEMRRIMSTGPMASC